CLSSNAVGGAGALRPRPPWGASGLRGDQAAMTIKEAAEYLGVSQGTIRNLIKAKRLGHWRIPGVGRGVIRIDESDLETFKQSCRVDVVQPKKPQPKRIPAELDPELKKHILF